MLFVWEPVSCSKANRLRITGKRVDSHRPAYPCTYACSFYNTRISPNPLCACSGDFMPGRVGLNSDRLGPFTPRNQTPCSLAQDHSSLSTCPLPYIPAYLGSSLHIPILRHYFSAPFAINPTFPISLFPPFPLFLSSSPNPLSPLPSPSYKPSTLLPALHLPFPTAPLPPTPAPIT